MRDVGTTFGLSQSIGPCVCMVAAARWQTAECTGYGDDGHDSNATNESIGLGPRGWLAGECHTPGAASQPLGTNCRPAGGKQGHCNPRCGPATITLAADMVRTGWQVVKRGVKMELLALLGFLVVLAVTSHFFGADSRKFDRPNWW